jgi:hypothetical protein
MVARQNGGASLFNATGTLDGNGGSVSISTPASGDTIRNTSMTLGGTHTLAPKNFDRDESADANFPDHAAVIGSSIPALDLKSVSLSDDSTSVTVNMQIADLTTTALAAAPDNGRRWRALSDADAFRQQRGWVAAEIVPELRVI